MVYARVQLAADFRLTTSCIKIKLQIVPCVILYFEFILSLSGMFDWILIADGDYYISKMTESLRRFTDEFEKKGVDVFGKSGDDKEQNNLGVHYKLCVS